MARRKNISNTAKLIAKNFDLKNAVLRERQIIDDFCRENIKDSDGNDVVRVVDPIHVLLNQERLERTLGNTAAQKFIDSFRNQSNDPFAELRKKCSDDDLKCLIKSRHLQSPAEILAWSKHMRENMDLFTSEVNKMLAEQRASEKKDSVEPPKSE